MYSAAVYRTVLGNAAKWPGTRRPSGPGGTERMPFQSTEALLPRVTQGRCEAKLCAS